MSAERWLAGRHAVVTGGSKGIGAAVASELARRGAAVTIMGRDTDALDRAAAEMSATHDTTVRPVRCDVADADAVASAFAEARDHSGDPYVLVNNAGIAEGAPILDTTREQWDRMLAVNLTGAWLCTRETLPAMLAAKAGRVVNVASTSGLKGYRNITAYCASKHGLVGLTRALAAETARAGITVNAVCPAYVDTDMTDRAVSDVARDMDRTPEEARAMIVRGIQRGSLIRPEEVASAVAWLCSPDASGTSGQEIVVAGGLI